MIVPRALDIGIHGNDDADEAVVGLNALCILVKASAWHSSARFWPLEMQSRIQVWIDVLGLTSDFAANH